MEVVSVLILILGAGWAAIALSRSLRSNDTSEAPPVEPETISAPRPFNRTAAPPTPVRRFVEGPAYVVDGDTIVVRKTQIRLFGIDAPELDHPYGKKAKWALVSLCKGTTVRAEIIEQDKHGRTVAQCYLKDGRDLSAEMVKQGLAIDWPKFSGGKYRSLEIADARKRMWLADARQKGRVDVWEKFQSQQQSK